MPRPGAGRPCVDSPQTSTPPRPTWPPGRRRGERVWFDRARSILRLVGETAARCGFALPDLYDEEWRPLPASSDQAPVELIRPGDTLPGLGFKAARLIGQTYAILTHMGEKPGPWMIDTATALYDRALADGWTNEGVGGIVYTLDPAGVVAAPQRMHWVVCEAASAARVLAEVVDPSRAEDLAVDYARAIAWADSHARAGMGRWIHEIAPDGSVSMLVWEGRPDALTAARMLARGAAPDPSHSHRCDRRPLRLPGQPERVLLTIAEGPRPRPPMPGFEVCVEATTRKRYRPPTISPWENSLHMILSA